VNGRRSRRSCSAAELFQKEGKVDSYIVRVYRQEKKNPRMIVGTVEKVGKRGISAFTNMSELWEIVDKGADGRVKRRKETQECGADGKGAQAKKG
jgi:hypothetical protein